MPNEPTLDNAAHALADFAGGPVVSATRAIEDAVAKSFHAVENTIARAVVSGKLSMSSLVDAIIRDFDRIAAREFLIKPLENLLSSAVTAMLPLGGARAAGGPVEAGQAYLVGEQGPEWFVPQTNGAVAANARPSITLNVQARDAQSFLKSETQLAAMLSRALARGQRNM